MAGVSDYAQGYRPQTAESKKKAKAKQRAESDPRNKSNYGGITPATRRGYQPPLVREPEPSIAAFRPPTSGFRFAGDKGYIGFGVERDPEGQTSNSSALPPNFLEYLARYGSSATADTSGIDAQEALARQRAQEGGQAIGGLYSSLASQLGAQAPQIDQRYAAAQAQAQQLADQTTSAIQAGGAAASAQRAALLRSLGMEDQVNANVSQEAEADMVDATSDAALARQGTGNLLTSGQQVQRDLNSANQTASLQRGTEEQAALQRALAEQLANFSTQRAEAQSAAQGQGFDMAKLMFDTDNSRYNQDREFSAGRDDEMWNRALEDRRLQTQAPQAPQDKSVTGQIEARMKADRVPPKAQQAILEMLMSGDAVNEVGRGTITPELIRSYGLDPAKYTPAYIGKHAMEFWRAYQK